MPSAMLNEMQHFWGMGLRGKHSSLAESSASAALASSFGLRAIERIAALGATGFAPIASKVASNKRWLKRRRAAQF